MVSSPAPPDAVSQSRPQAVARTVHRYGFFLLRWHLHCAPTVWEPTGRQVPDGLVGEHPRSGTVWSHCVPQRLTSAHGLLLAEGSWAGVLPQVGGLEVGLPVTPRSWTEACPVHRVQSLQPGRARPGARPGLTQQTGSSV